MGDALLKLPFPTKTDHINSTRMERLLSPTHTPGTTKLTCFTLINQLELVSLKLDPSLTTLPTRRKLPTTWPSSWKTSLRDSQNSKVKISTSLENHTLDTTSQPLPTTSNSRTLIN